MTASKLVVMLNAGQGRLSPGVGFEEELVLTLSPSLSLGVLARNYFFGFRNRLSGLAAGLWLVAG